MKKLIIILMSSQVFAFIPASFKTNYVQVFKSQVGKGDRKAQGVFEYKYPGLLRVDQLAPEKLLYVSNKTKTWIYRPPFFDDEPAEVTVHTGQDKSLSSFFDVLKAGLKSNGNYKVETKKLTSILSFNTASKKRLGINTATLIFNKKQDFKNLTEIKIDYTDGRKVSLSLSKTEVDNKYSKGHFNFVIPKGSKIIKQ